jgi:DNA-binding transcriptional MerR regulator
LLTFLFVGRPVKSGANNSKKRYKTNEVCRLFDVSRATLFRWEREGLISGPQRDWRNWRMYTVTNIKEIKQIIQTRSTGA